MKRNKMMRLASLMLVLTMLSTCAISGTFAKYVSTDSVTDNARVAYWGFGSDMITETDINLFSPTYNNVASKDGTANVVAPGNSNEVTLSLVYTPNGTTNTAPEVAYNYDVVAVATSTNGYSALDANENFKWTLTVPGATQAVSYDTVSELVTAINATTEDVAVNKLPKGYDETTGKAEYKIGWDWTYEVDAAGNTADTAMGNDTTPDDVTLTITITATQKD